MQLLTRQLQNIDRAETTAGLRSFLQRIYGYMAGGLALTGLVAYWAAASGVYAAIAGTPWIWPVLLAPLGLVLFLGFRIQNMSLAGAQAAFWIYAASLGLSLAGIFLLYTGVSVARVFFVTAGTFGAMSLYGYATRRNLDRLGTFLVMGLIGVVIASLVNVFISSSALDFVVAVIGVIVFVGLTAYDTQKIKAMYAEGDAIEATGRKAVIGALTLYLDFINLFLLLLRLFGDRRR